VIIIFSKSITLFYTFLFYNGKCKNTKAILSLAGSRSPL
jgi:hypothetical protein